MAGTVGLICAAGFAERWGGVLKELLPVANGITLLERCAWSMIKGGADRLVLVTRASKLASQMDRLQRAFQHTPIAAVLRPADPGTMWDSMQAGLRFCRGARVLFGMPDTLFDGDVFQRLVKDDPTFGLGLFETTQRGRFGILRELTVTDKEKGGMFPAMAWGVATWSWSVTEQWLSTPFHRYDEAFSHALTMALDSDDVNPHVYLKEYRDFASWGDYTEWMQHNVHTTSQRAEIAQEFRG